MEYSYYVLVSIEGDNITKWWSGDDLTGKMDLITFNKYLKRNNDKITKWWSGDDLTGKMGLIPFTQYLKKNAEAAGSDLNNFEIWHFLQGIIEKTPLEMWMKSNKKEVEE